MPCKNQCRPRGRCRKLQESLTESKVIFFLLAIQFCTAVRVYTYVCGWWVLPPQLPLPSLFLFNVTGLAHMTLSSSTGTARVSYLACMHSWTGSARHRNKKKSSWCGPIDISAATHLPLYSLFYSISASSYLFSWWEEFHQDTVTLTSVSDWGRNRISKCLSGLHRFFFKSFKTVVGACMEYYIVRRCPYSPLVFLDCFSLLITTEQHVENKVAPNNFNLSCGHTRSFAWF